MGYKYKGLGEKYPSLFCPIFMRKEAAVKIKFLIAVILATLIILLFPMVVYVGYVQDIGEGRLLVTLPGWAFAGFNDSLEAALSFFSRIVILIGGAVAIWGFFNLLYAYASDSISSKAQGIKQLMVGVGIVLIGIAIPELFSNLI